MDTSVNPRQERVIRIVVDFIVQNGIHKLTPLGVCEITGIPPHEMIHLFENKQVFIRCVLGKLNEEMDKLSDQLIGHLESVLELEHLLHEENGTDERGNEEVSE